MYPEKSLVFPSLKNIRLFIFDLDGTLYDQVRLRKRIVRLMLSRLITFKMRLSELKIISAFRHQREDHKGYEAEGLEDLQYFWTAKETGKPVETVKNILIKYMYNEPLPYLKRAIYPGVEELFDVLHKKKITIAIYSDYPVKDKLTALGLYADILICSTDKGIDQLKPGEKAIKKIFSDAGCLPEETIFIGDRDDTDGISAQMAGVTFLKLDTEKARKGIFYSDLTNVVNSHYE